MASGRAAYIEPRRSFVAYAGEDRYPVAKGIEAIGVIELAQELASSR